MLINRQREKMINAIIYFAENTRRCHKVKLFKLLYFLDFEHYALTGRSVTGLEYFALPNGPYPESLNPEIEPIFDDSIILDESVIFKKTPFRNNPNLKPKLEIVPLKKFDQNHFSKREMKIMEKLAEKYRDHYAYAIIDETHLENSPWDKTYNKNKEKNSRIPYKLALKKQEKEEMMRYIEEMQNFWRDYEYE